ncbi:dipeptidase PepE [Aureivirga marina]|uniref:dipeptidase PepE n=1 Tax=Aureivirga marina TaxID=1182451 RepID=UPI0018CABF8F|nr:dipeptidase PepE [Aureivirga marina]
MKNIIIASTSTVHGQTYLEYILPTLKEFYKGIEEILFIPYARPGGISHDAYTEIAGKGFQKIGINVKGIHTFDNPIEAIQNAKGIFTGGGNTFVLVNGLYENNIIKALQEAVNNGTPYLGTSAGSNICGQTINTTNDMPIVYPPSFKTLGFIHFNINPHYLDPNPDSTHMGETRETRIKEFHTYNSLPVLGLREGSWLEVKGEEIILRGAHSARLFLQGQEPKELNTNTLVSI